VVECAGLEIRYARKRIEGSNPSFSAKTVTANQRQLAAIVGHDVPGQVAKSGLITDLHPAPESVAQLKKAFA
jgi:hydroxymethylglutaryl-CoA lyase